MYVTLKDVLVYLEIYQMSVTLKDALVYLKICKICVSHCRMFWCILISYNMCVTLKDVLVYLKIYQMSVTLKDVLVYLKTCKMDRMLLQWMWRQSVLPCPPKDLVIELLKLLKGHVG